jgi:hypothetical protein
VALSRILFDERHRVTKCEKFTTRVSDSQFFADRVIEIDVRYDAVADHQPQKLMLYRERTSMQVLRKIAAPENAPD